MILGCDISSEYQVGFDVYKAYGEGLRFIAVKLSDGTKGIEPYEEGIDVIRKAQELRMVTVGYHYIRAGVDVKLQSEMFAEQLRRAGCPGMLDLENGTIDELREIHYGVRQKGRRVSFTYLPKWYWSRIGSPSLAGLPPLWASRYVTDANKVEVTGKPADIVKGVQPDWWADYGNKKIEVLQFSQKASIAGFVMDADVFRGNLAQLEKLSW